MKEEELHTDEILIADDNAENLRVLSDILRKEGYKIRIAQNGRQALASIEASEPDLLLLDVHMPEMDGFTVCKNLKSDEKNHILPIIFISALQDTFNKLQAFEAGAVDYITKPFEIKEVTARIKTHLKLRLYTVELKNLKQQLIEKDKEIERLKSKVS